MEERKAVVPRNKKATVDNGSLQRKYEEFKTKVENTQFEGSDDEAYIESEEEGADEEDIDELRDDFSLSNDAYEDFTEDVIDVDEDGEEEGEEDAIKREREFFGDEDYTLLSKVPEEEEEQEDQLSQTQQQRELKQKLDRVQNLKKEIAQLQAKIQMQKELGEHHVGKAVIFQELIDKYEMLASSVDDTTEEQQQEIYDEFISPIETDMSKAEILPICNTLNRLRIGLNFRR